MDQHAEAGAEDEDHDYSDGDNPTVEPSRLDSQQVPMAPQHFPEQTPPVTLGGQHPPAGESAHPASGGRGRHQAVGVGEGHPAPGTNGNAGGGHPAPGSNGNVGGGQSPPTGQPSNVPPSSKAPGGQGPRSGKNPNSAKGKKSPPEPADADKRCSSMTSKPNLATVFQESKALETDFKMKYMEKREEWRMADIMDRREAREDEFKRRKLDLDFEIEKRQWEATERLNDRRESAYQASMERSHRIETAKQSNLFSLAIALVNKDKSIDDIKAMYDLFEKN